MDFRSAHLWNVLHADGCFCFCLCGSGAAIPAVGIILPSSAQIVADANSSEPTCERSL